jgi:hypothetical protein
MTLPLSRFGSIKLPNDADPTKPTKPTKPYVTKKKWKTKQNPEDINILTLGAKPKTPRKRKKGRHMMT